MPQRVWKQSEIEFAVPLFYDGYSWTDIAKMLTFSKLSSLGLSEAALAACEAVNQDRKRDTRIKVLLPQMRLVLESYGELTKVLESQLRESIVTPLRLTRMSETDRWQTYYQTYASSQEARYAERVRQ